jgi:hypothetical protein
LLREKGKVEEAARRGGDRGDARSGKQRGGEERKGMRERLTGGAGLSAKQEKKEKRSWGVG